MNKKVKSIDGLMRHLRDTHYMAINGSSQKQKLRNIGYYHDSKEYHYNKSPQNKLANTDFNQILAMNEFDMPLKTMLYPQLSSFQT